MIYQAIDHLISRTRRNGMFATFISWQLMQWASLLVGLPDSLFVLSFVGRHRDRAIAWFSKKKQALAKAPILTNVAGFIELIALLKYRRVALGFHDQEYRRRRVLSAVSTAAAHLHHQAHDRRHGGDLICSISSFNSHAWVWRCAPPASVPESARLVASNPADDRAGAGAWRRIGSDWPEFS